MSHPRRKVRVEVAGKGTEMSSVEFSEATRQDAYRRCGGRCECDRKEHKHVFGRCTSWFLWPINRPEYHHVTAREVGGTGELSNCQVLCNWCHTRTESYGRWALARGRR